MPDSLPPPDPDEPAPAIPPAASATEALYRAALGPRRVAGYLSVFARYDELGVARPHWNHAAGWLGWHWLFYRRLWREAFALLALLLAALAAWWWAHEALGPWPPGVRWGLLAAILTVAVVAPGWWGNGWLHADVRRRMTAAVRQARTVQEACDWLARPSPTRWVWLAVVALEVGLAGWWWTQRPAPDPALPVAGPEPVVAERRVDTPPADTPTAPSAPASEPANGPANGPAVTAAVTEPAAPPAPVAEPASVGQPALASQPAPAIEPAPAAETPAPAPPAAPPAEPALTGSVEADPALRPRLEGHGVAVGMFADPANAERAVKRLREAGLPVVSDPVESSRGTLTRVRVGPFPTQAQAQAAAGTVRQLGLDARVFGPR